MSADTGKRSACVMAVDQHVRDGMKIGIGSGSTIVFAVERIKQRVDKEGLKLVCVPTSFQARELIVKANLPLGDLIQHPVLDLAIDGADEVDANLNCIKGGGGCHLQEKLVASAAKTFVVVADDSKKQQVLGTSWRKGIPLEVVGMAEKLVSVAVERLGGKPMLRLCTGGKAGPVVTDNGNLIIDADFGQVTDVAKLNEQLIQIPGVVETGLFVNMVTCCFFGTKDGKVLTI